MSQRLIDAVSQVFGVGSEAAAALLEKKVFRTMVYRDVVYLALRRDYAGHREGTLLAVGRRGFRLVPGYPSIGRILLLSRAMPRHFVDKVVVEEKMDGYNVRVFTLEGEIYAATRGGYICPYTTARIRRLYGPALKGLFEAEGEDLVVIGEVVGVENPYVRFPYPEAPGFAFKVFDMARCGDFLAVEERNRLVSKHGLDGVPILGVVDKHDVSAVRRIVRGLEEKGREGVVFKDPGYRVPPLKYTTGHINVDDLKLGMKFFFDEGRTFLFPRILRQIFLAYEEGWDRRKLEKEAARLGMAILEPAVESVRRVVDDEGLYEEYVLVFSSESEMEEFETYMSSLGVAVMRGQVASAGGELRVLYRKLKDTAVRVSEIIESGLSPLD